MKGKNSLTAPPTSPLPLPPAIPSLRPKKQSIASRSLSVKHASPAAHALFAFALALGFEAQADMDMSMFASASDDRRPAKVELGIAAGA